jgi:hypothetical protein
MTTHSPTLSTAPSPPPSPRSRVWRGIGSWLVILLLVAVDTVLAKPAFALVLRDSNAASWAAAAGIGITACVAMVTAGAVNRVAHDVGRMAHARAVTLIGMWLLMGLFIAGIRVLGVSELTAGIGPSDTGGVSTGALAQAAAFLAVYVVVGILAYGDGHARTSPRA